MKKNNENKKSQDVKIMIKDGKEIDIPVEGSLGLLALGAVGIRAWRRKQKEINYINPNENLIVTESEKDKEKEKPGKDNE